MRMVLSLTIVVAIGPALSACGTSKEARALAKETAVAVQSLDVAISANAAAAKVNAARADARIENLIRSTAESRADLQARIDADDAARRDFERLQQFADKQEANRQRMIGEASTQVKALAAARLSATPVSPALREIGDKLGALGKEGSVLDRVKTVIGFVKDVAARVKDGQKAAKEASKEAETTEKKASAAGMSDS